MIAGIQSGLAARSIDYIADSKVDAALDAQLRALLSACFTGPHNERFKTQRYYNEMPQHRWLIREPGRVIAHVALHDKIIGTAAGDQRIGGVAEVAVHPDFRGRGLVQQLLAKSHDWLAAQGVPFGFLFGDWAVYKSSGYVPVKNLIRRFVPERSEWVTEPISGAMVKVIGKTPWPDGEIDLRGPTF
jgi:predicted N-acetyltransferase YhbS